MKIFISILTLFFIGLNNNISMASSDTLKLTTKHLIFTKPDSSESLKELCSKSSLTVVSFFYYYCNPCKAELNIVSDSLAAWKSRVDFNFIAVNTCDSLEFYSKCQNLASRNMWNFPLYFDYNFGNRLKDFFQIPRYPAIYIFDANGVLLFSDFGDFVKENKLVPTLIQLKNKQKSKKK
jgi:hypothetical protein